MDYIVARRFIRRIVEVTRTDRDARKALNNVLQAYAFSPTEKQRLERYLTLCLEVADYDE